MDLGQDLIPANEWNVAGYWESREILETHQNILKELNCDWHNPPLSFPANWWRKPEIQELKSRLLGFVRSECKRKEKIWGFKDPRTAILLPMWREIFDELQLEPLYILAVRHPGSVAASLSRRDGLSSSHVQALWLKTNLDALSYTRNRLRAIVDYDRWFDSGLEQARTVIDFLNLTGSIREAQIVEAVNQVILSRLRHHSGKEDAICSPTVERFYSLLYQATTNGKISDEISAITETFEKATDLLNIWDELVVERDATIAKRNDTIAGREATIAEREATIAERDATIADRNETIAEREATIAERDATIAERELANRTRLRKQRQLFTYIIISIVAVFSLISLFVLSSHNWFK